MKNRILFICHGNICRSPMAKMIFLALLGKQGREGEFVVDSCATSREEIRGGVGNPLYPPAKRMLERMHVPVLPHRARQLKREDYRDFDLLVCMDENNVRNAKRMMGSDPLRKIVKLMDFTASPRDVADPWYTDDFESCYDDILEGCIGLLGTLGIKTC